MKNDKTNPDPETPVEAAAVESPKPRTLKPFPGEEDEPKPSEVVLETVKIVGPCGEEPCGAG